MLIFKTYLNNFMSHWINTLFKTSTYSTNKIINCSSNSGAHLLAHEIGFYLGLFQLKLPKQPESIFYPSTFQGIGFFWLKACQASHIQKNKDFGNHHGHSAHVAFSCKGFPIMVAKFHNPFKIAFLSVIFWIYPSYPVTVTTKTYQYYYILSRECL